jgi:hypothetical protein
VCPSLSPLLLSPGPSRSLERKGENKGECGERHRDGEGKRESEREREGKSERGREAEPKKQPQTNWLAG